METKEQIEMLLENGITKQNIAEAFNMSVDEIDKIVSSEQVKVSVAPAAPARQRVRGIKYDETKFNEGKRLRAQGWTYPRIAKYQGFSKMFVYKALQNKTYADMEEMRERERIYKATYKASKKTARKPEHNTAPTVETVRFKVAPEKVEPVSGKVKQETLEETLAKHATPSDDRMYTEVRSIADSLTRIAEALESKKKKGLFRR